MKISVFDITGKKLEDLMVNKEVFGVEANPVLMAQAVRVYQSNQRQASARVQTGQM